MADIEVDTNAYNKDFETAITAAGFGLFNICLLLVAFPGTITTIFETSSTSFILPIAECDLSLSLLEKGVLNAVTFAAMIITAFPWGYIGDTVGRKNILVYGFLIDGLCVLGAALSQNFVQLLVFKFVGGMIVSGPFAIIMTFISEYHGKNYRHGIVIVAGMMKTVASVLLPAMALAILPHNWDFQISSYKFHTWQIFLATTAVPPILSGALFTFFPESPKFQMSQGKNAQALEAFQKIYAINTGKERDTFPIKSLIDESPEKTAKIANKALNTNNITTKEKLRNINQSFRDGLKQLRPMFCKPYLGLSITVYSMLLCILIGLNGLRLWLPQLFATITELESNGMGMPNMCFIMEYNLNKSRENHADKANNGVCEVVIDPEAYTSVIIIAAATLFGFIFAFFLENVIGNNNILTISTFMASACGYALYWSNSALATLVIASVFISVASIASSSVITASINMFPTSMRSMVMVMLLTFGRIGSLLGSFSFLMLTAIGCIVPFIVIGTVFLIAFFISWFLPNTSRTDLK